VINAARASCSHLKLFVAQSEKKYSHKAAAEYKKFLSKAVHESSEHNLNSLLSKSDDADDPKGLDGLISSLAATATTNAAPAGTSAVPAAVTAVVVTETTVFRSTPPPAPKGTLNISAAASTDNLAGQAGASSHGNTPPPAPDATASTGSIAENAAEDSPNTAAAEANADALKMLKLGAKKPPAKKAGMGAKKLVTSSSADVRIESFELVETRAATAAQEEEDRRLAQQLQAQENANASSGRVAAMMAEADGTGKSSLYRSTSNTSSNTNLSSGSSSRYQTASPAPSASAYRSAPAAGGTTASKGGGESYAARNKYGAQKGISSDQYFGRDEADAAQARARLGQLQGSQAISSDMVYGRGGDRQDSSDDGGATLEKLKDSVAGFFDSFGK
jgi:ADP-ribosylation factor GTPase-activating protein 2/3